MTLRYVSGGEEEAKERSSATLWMSAALKHQEQQQSLVKTAIALLDKFNTGKQGLDDFIKNASEDLQNEDAQDKTFILDLIVGCTEYKKVLDAVVDVFYSQNFTWINRRDRSQFVVICYLTTFVLNDIGFQRFSDIIKSLDARKMYTFLHFFSTNLTTWIQEEWNKIYDASYVEKHWIGPLLKWHPDIEILVDHLAVRMSCMSQAKKPPVKITKPQEFSLTKPKPRPLPMPELIPLQEKSKPVPQSTYQAPKEARIIEEMKQKNHQRTEELMHEANMKLFRVGNPQKSERTVQVMSQIQEELNSKYKFKFYSSGPPPSTKISSCPVKLNSAAALRQEALRNRLREKELQRLEHLAKGALEASTFYQWQKEMREKDLQEELERIECRRLEGHISYDAAVRARALVMERNQKSAQLKKEETAELMRRYADKRLQEEKEIRDLVQQVAEGHKNSKAAKEKIQKFKQSIVKEVSGQTQELLQQALEDAQAEMSRRFEIIREIRIMESMPHIRINYFDETETAGHQLLAEMSMAELKERLSRLKVIQQAEVHEKRRQILEVKETKKRLHLERMENNDLYWKAMAQAAVARREEEKAMKSRHKQYTMPSDKILALRKQHEELRQERQRLKEIDRSKATNVRHVTKSTPVQQANTKKSWKELQLSLERHIQEAS
ncbi:hypothetical protein JOB18_015627 [Solea senegalensis]|uniref:Cilia and flagella associated protein 99 n=1 Tax=Solea senegalensis TaxID=28829 RepID=A0AAV6RXV6_SOLSE|nr:cilia- and flagella-associated protein 99 [Solea senegalensis]KAG7510190.1 hypothetical protein JOB18_015627 [Solea senegalensis]